MLRARIPRRALKKRLRAVAPEPYLRTSADAKPYLVRPFEEIKAQAQVYNKREVERGLAAEERPEPVVAALYPVEVRGVDLDRKYKWCSCGLSRYQPFCDQACAGSAFAPLVFTVEQPVRAMYLCACKLTSAAPFCDHRTCQALRDRRDKS